MSPHWNWNSPTPLAASECALPPGPKGGGAHSPAAKGVGESQFQRLEKRLALCLLCGIRGTLPFNLQLQFFLVKSVDTFSLLLYVKLEMCAALLCVYPHFFWRHYFFAP
jgi:hypothetical protein